MRKYRYGRPILFEIVRHQRRNVRKFQARLRAPNGKILLRSDTYPRKQQILALYLSVFSNGVIFVKDNTGITP
jgi:uncharacterized protein YegP (UPF0339 family)